MRSRQKYRMRTPSTGREVIVEAEPGQVYVDRETGEPLEVVGELLPLAPTLSELPGRWRTCASATGATSSPRRISTTARTAAGAWSRSAPEACREDSRCQRLRPAATVGALMTTLCLAACGGGGSGTTDTAGAPAFTVPTSAASAAAPRASSSTSSSTTSTTTSRPPAPAPGRPPTRTPATSTAAPTSPGTGTTGGASPSGGAGTGGAGGTGGTGADPAAPAAAAAPASAPPSASRTPAPVSGGVGPDGRGPRRQDRGVAASERTSWGTGC